MADERGRSIVELGNLGICPLGKFAAADPSLVETIMHGAAGIAKAVAGIDPASKETVDRRRLACFGDATQDPPLPRCEQAASGGVCNKCGCWLWAKIRNAGEKCPIGKW